MLATLISACDPGLEQQYYRQGIGTEIVNPYAIDVTELQDTYLAELCRQAGCTPGEYSAAWWLVVQAGMNDIDARCDAYLAWLDDRRRSHGPILSEISALSAATQSIMKFTGSGANPITIVGVAFGLASDTFTNVHSRLLLEVNHSTVQSVVLSKQQEYRNGLKGQGINTRVMAIYALRSYLRLCMPMTIETQINSTVTIYEQAGARALQNTPPLIDPRTVGGVALRAAETIRQPDRAPRPVFPPEVAALFISPSDLSPQEFKSMQAALCVPNHEIGWAGDYTKGAIQIYGDAKRPPSQAPLSEKDVNKIIGLKECVAGGGKNYFERQMFDHPKTGTDPLGDLVRSLNAAQPENPLPNVKTLEEARPKIAAVRAALKTSQKLKEVLPTAFDGQVTPKFYEALP
jgi:hypothetical protein